MFLLLFSKIVLLSPLNIPVPPMHWSFAFGDIFQAHVCEQSPVIE